MALPTVGKAATDVWYVSSYRATRVEFDIDKPAFLDWCREQDWLPVPIRAEHPTTWYSDRKQDTIAITSGVRFATRNQQKPDLGFSGVYDAAAERAYVLYTGG